MRQKYGLDEGDIFTLIDLGGGSFLLTPHVSQVNRLGGRVMETLREQGVSADELIEALDEEREHYYRQHYAPESPAHAPD
jgi:hypothetical protein